jgi:hypothetical protein
MKISKAEQQRQKYTRERLVQVVGLKLRDFENRYMSAYTEWNILQEKKKDRFPELRSWDEAKEFLVGKSRVAYRVPRSSYTRKKEELYAGEINQNDAYSAWRKVEVARRRIQLDSLLRFEFMQEAAEGYKIKFERLIDKMLAEDFNSHKMQVERVGSGQGRELEILVSDDKARVFHARAIWVEGSIKAPHYRFITTTRSK